MKKFSLYILIMCVAPLATCAQDSLHTYIVAALQENPAVMARWHAYEAATENVCPAGTLGDPELSLSFFPKPMEQVNGRQVASVSLMQMFPWFGALKWARSEKAWQAEAAWQQYREDGIALAYEVERQWYGLLVVREQLATVRRHLRLFADIREQQLYRYKTGSAQGARLSDQYRLQAEQLKLEEQAESLKARLRLQQSQFNLLLHRQPESPLVLPDSIALAEMPVAEWADIESRSPGLLALKARSAQYDAQEQQARRKGLPMVGVGVEYMVNQKSDRPAAADMNGMDMWMGMLKVSLPIYRHRVKAQRKAASLLKLTADEDYQRQADVLRAQLLGVAQRADDARRKMRLYRRDKELLAQTLDLMQHEYAAGTTPLSELLQASREQLDYAYGYAESCAQYNMTVAEFEKLASLQDYTKR